MIQSLLKTAFFFCAASFFIGCSIDRAQIVSHPSAAKPGDTISVFFSDVYVIVSDSSVLKTEYKRDSVHAVYGLPAGWSVLSSDYYVANGFKINDITRIATDTTLLEKMVQDSLAAFTANKTAMKKDDSWKKYFVNKTLDAHGFKRDSIKVAVDSVGQWLPYAAKIDFHFPVGTKMDTSIAVSSLPIDTAAIPAIVTLLYGNVKELWIKTVPIICFARIVTGQTEGDFNLYYFTKTGILPTSSSFSLVPNFDQGDLTYAPININMASAVVQVPGNLPAGVGLLRLSNGPGSSTLIEVTQRFGALSIFDVTGKTIKRLGSTGAKHGVFIWDWTNASGAAVKAGSYVVRLESNAGNVSKQVRVVR
jgi:hypothetical protein